MFIKAAFYTVLFIAYVGICYYVTLKKWHEKSDSLPYFCGAYFMAGCAFSLMLNAVGGLFE